MKLQDYQTKACLREHGIVVPEGKLAKTPEGILEASMLLGGGVSIRVQDPDFDSDISAKSFVSRDINKIKDYSTQVFGDGGQDPIRVLVEKEVQNIKYTLYVGLFLNVPTLRNRLVIVKNFGDDISRRLAEDDQVFSIALTPSQLISEEAFGEMRAYMGISDEEFSQLSIFLQKLYTTYVNADMVALELCPLGFTITGFVPLLSKSIMDDNGLYRQKVKGILTLSNEDPTLLEMAQKQGFAFERYDGKISVLANGVGLARTTVDALIKEGGTACHLMALPGGAGYSDVQKAIAIALQDSHVKGIFINIFGGLTRCDEVAKGILESLSRRRMDFPVVIRFSGTRCREAEKIIASTSLVTAKSLDDGVKKILQMMKVAYS